MKQRRTIGVRHRKAPFATFENSSNPPVHAEHAGTGAALTRPSRRPSRTAGHLGLTRSPGFTRGYSHPLPTAAVPTQHGQSGEWPRSRAGGWPGLGLLGGLDLGLLGGLDLGLAGGPDLGLVVALQKIRCPLAFGDR